MNRFENKVALVTGTARGIGRGVALKLASEGASVVVNDFTNMGAAQVVEEIKTTSQDTLSIQADFSDKDAVAAMVRTL